MGDSVAGRKPRQTVTMPLHRVQRDMKALTDVIGNNHSAIHEGSLHHPGDAQLTSNISLIDITQLRKEPRLSSPPNSNPHGCYSKLKISSSLGRQHLTALGRD